MTTDLKNLFERHAQWQRDQAKLPWAEKLRLAVVMRESLLALKQPQRDERAASDHDEQRKHTNRQ